MKKVIVFVSLSAAALLVMQAQNTEIRISRIQGKPKLAVPDFRGAGDAQKFMTTFNQTLWNDLDASALFDLIPKTSMPLFVPQQPADFQTPTPSAGRSGGGRWMRDWAEPPAGASHLAFGYTAVQGGS